jgi:hypothetical protein
MAQPPSDARRYAYEMQPDPAAERGGREFVFRPKPLTVGDRLHHWQVVTIERAAEDTELLRVPISGPPGFRRQPDAIWGGRLTLRRVP